MTVSYLASYLGQTNDIITGITIHK